MGTSKQSKEGGKSTGTDGERSSKSKQCGESLGDSSEKSREPPLRTLTQNVGKGPVCCARKRPCCGGEDLKAAMRVNAHAVFARSYGWNLQMPMPCRRGLKAVSGYMETMQ